MEDYVNQENFIGDFLRIAGQVKKDNQMKNELLEMLNQPLSNRTVRKYLEEINENELLTIMESSVDLGMDLLSEIINVSAIFTGCPVLVSVPGIAVGHSTWHCPH